MSVHQRFQHEDLEAIRVGRFKHGIFTSFIVYRLGGTLIDCGPNNQWRYVKPFVQEKPLEQLILTHHHEDHSGNAAAIKKLTGITAIAPEPTRELIKVPLANSTFAQKLIWGTPGLIEADPLSETLTTSGGEPITKIFAPGHASDMHCYVLPERGWLFSADLYIANRLKIIRADENVSTLLESIRKVLSHDFETILCPHRGVVPDGKKRLQEKHDFIVNLADQAQTLTHKGHGLIDVTERLLGKEDWVAKMSFYDFSKRNLIRSCLDIAL